MVNNKSDSEFTFIDLFAGIGGTRLGFEAANGKCVFSSEWDKFAQQTYKANFCEIPAGDITKINATSIPKFEVLLAGFPCQPFSSIGKRKGFQHDTQGTLFFDIARILDVKRPPAILLENVPGLITHNKRKTFKTILNVLAELGYEVHYEILDAENFGVPQKRKRIYIAGFRKDLLPKDMRGKFSFPSGQSSKSVDIGKYLEKNIEGYSISKHLQKVYLFKKDDGRPTVVDTKTKGPARTLVASYHKIQRLTGTFVKDGPTGLRLLSENECKSLMGYKKSFKFPVSRTQMYRQLGNSIVIPVARKIALEMKPYILSMKK